jgi:YHS domain-containing protein
LTFGDRTLRIVRRIFMAKDPVCGMNVEETKAAATSSYKGQTYYFCAKVCKESFDKDPEKYLDKNR